MSSRRLFLTFGLIGLVLLMSGCAALRAASARANYINNATHKHVYDMPCKSIWPDTREMLFELGYTVRHTGEGALTLETRWERFTHASGEYYEVRYLVQGVERTPNTCQTRFTQSVREADGRLSTDRDLDIEWQLLQRIDPDAASAIMQEANLRADMAR